MNPIFVGVFFKMDPGSLIIVATLHLDAAVRHFQDHTAALITHQHHIFLRSTKRGDSHISMTSLSIAHMLSRALPISLSLSLSLPLSLCFSLSFSLHIILQCTRHGDSPIFMTFGNSLVCMTCGDCDTLISVTSSYITYII